MGETSTEIKGGPAKGHRVDPAVRLGAGPGGVRTHRSVCRGYGAEEQGSRPEAGERGSGAHWTGSDRVELRAEALLATPGGPGRPTALGRDLCGTPYDAQATRVRRSPILARGESLATQRVQALAV